MHSVGFDFPLATFFDFKIKNTLLPPGLVANYLKKALIDISESQQYKLMWHQVSVKDLRKTSKGKELSFTNRSGSLKLEMPDQAGLFWLENSQALEVISDKKITLDEFILFFSKELNMDFNQIQKQEWWKKLKQEFLWIVR